MWQSRSPPVRDWAAFALQESVVASCLDTHAPRDRLLDVAWRRGLPRLTRRERAAVAGVTGHAAESVIEALLEPLGWAPLWHLVGPGRHGVDLVLLAPGDLLVALEVKGTLVAGRIPRLSSGDLVQMSTAWLDKVDNPGMAEFDLASSYICGAVTAVNFTDLSWRMTLTRDFSTFEPIVESRQLADLAWLLSTDDGRFEVIGR